MTNDQNNAWLAVCHTLDQVMPEWQTLKRTGQQSAIEAIKRLAAQSDAATVSDLAKRASKLARDAQDLSNRISAQETSCRD